MNRESLGYWASLGETVGGAALIFSLVVVTFEIRVNPAATRRQPPVRELNTTCNR